MMNQVNGYASLLLDLLATDGQHPEGLIIGVTSAMRGEGRTKLAVELAEKLSKEVELTTMLADLDFDQPRNNPKHRSMNSYLGLAEGALSRNTLQKLNPNLWVSVADVGAAYSLKLSVGLLEEGLPLDRIRQTLGSNFVTVVDLPPLLDSPLGLRMAGLATRLVMAVRANSTTAGTVRQALERLDEVGYRSKLSHTVLIGARRRTPNWLLRMGLQ